jgi:hypothetical protein
MLNLGQALNKRNESHVAPGSTHLQYNAQQEKNIEIFKIVLTQ